MRTRFILSLDCEGRWGVADHVGPRERAGLTDDRLRRAYQDILGLLDEYDVPATFAFVGCFAADARGHPLLREMPKETRSFLGNALQDMDVDEGWDGSWAVDCTGSAKTAHELALHGTTHVPWSRLSPDGARWEMELLGALETPIKRAKTFIYPRNDVAHTDVLAEYGISGYRAAAPRKGKLRSLASELNVFATAESDPVQREKPFTIPAGYFVNWQSGPRRAVPRQVSAVRVRNMLRNANGRVVHFWLHPENIATAPATLPLLRDIVEAAAAERDADRCDIMTQIGFCNSRQVLASVH